MDLIKSSGRLRGRSVALLLAGILAGTVLIQPAVAHFRPRIGHIIKHVFSRADPRYYNEGQTVDNARNADRLDGLDSTAFVGSDEVLWAVVNANATLARGQGVTSSARGSLPAGQYDVTFDRNVRNCAYVATPGQPGTDVLFDPTVISVSSDPDNVNGVRVETKNLGGGLTDEPFHLGVVC
jgi:hypothetical protein